jgi:hypothetical protein
MRLAGVNTLRSSSRFCVSSGKGHREARAPRSGGTCVPTRSVGTRKLALIAAVVACWATLSVPSLGQFKEAKEPESKSGQYVIRKWRIGMIVTAEGGEFRQIVGTVTVPTEWPEQQVRRLKEESSAGVVLSDQDIKGVARQMVVKIPVLEAGQEAKAIATYAVRRQVQIPPRNTDVFVIPNLKRTDPKFRDFLNPSPYIESSAPQIVETAKKIGADKQNAWDRVEAIYDWVREKVQFEDNQGGTVEGALATLRDGKGDCDEMTALFVALCRADGIPARTVRVPGHCYPEFYLRDRAGEGFWFPCQAAGTPAFGGMPDPRPVLQKGDNIQVTDPRTKKKTKVRFLPETLVAAPPTVGGSRLRLKLVCEPVEK